jgi:hypothetical protein
MEPLAIGAVVYGVGVFVVWGAGYLLISRESGSSQCTLDCGISAILAIMWPVSVPGVLCIFGMETYQQWRLTPRT